MDPTSTTTAAAAAASTIMSSTEGMPSPGSMGGCKVNMVWNWNTIDACILTPLWRTNSPAPFACICINVLCLAMMLQVLCAVLNRHDATMLRRAHDRQEKSRSRSRSNDQTTEKNLEEGSYCTNKDSGCCCRRVVYYRLRAWEKLVRSLWYTLVFANATILALLAVSFNGYIILCIFTGTFVGSYFFQMHRMGGHER
ncbi:hypothetical protein PG997_000705 [Apiospora hydei]|uniref:Copper transport protein n=1 Tax=Apiospora hydei TaxID=1337664 RepID=A0ABR1XBJ9_9PEZI